jgi:hypothetical protein
MAVGRAVDDVRGRSAGGALDVGLFVAASLGGAGGDGERKLLGGAGLGASELADRHGNS